MSGNGEDNVRCCSDVMKDMDEFVVYVFDDDEATEFVRKVFDDPIVAANFRRGSNPLTGDQREIIDEITKPSSFLDKMVSAEREETLPAKTKSDGTIDANAGITTTPADPIQELVFGMPSDEFDRKFKKAKKQFKKQRKNFEEKAKLALVEAAKLYLGDKHVKAYEKYKAQIDQSGLSSVMYQIHTMEETLHALSARVKASGAFLAPRDVEVLTALNRVMLDVQKFQFDYMMSIEKAMKELKADLEVAEHGGQQDSGEGTLLFFRGGKEFLRELAEMKNSMDLFKPTESKNKMLNPNAEVVDIQALEAGPNPEYTETTSNTTKNPFSGYEGAVRKPRKQRDDGEDNDDLSDFDM